MLILKPLNANNTEEIKFLFDTRSNPDVDKNLSGEMPANFNSHCDYIQLNYNVFNIAYVGDQMVGYSQINSEGEVGFAIPPKFQGKGYGKLLVTKTLEKAKKNHETVKLVVLKSNIKAIHIYEKYGFKIYADNDNEIFMNI